MGESQHTHKSALIGRHKRLHRRLFRRLSSKCRYCTGYEDKIGKKESSWIDSEVAEHEKHELINMIAKELGDEPAHLSQAEKILDSIKYSVTEYVLKHEFNHEASLSVQMTMWLEERKEPTLFKPLENVIHTYLKPRGTHGKSQG